MLNRVQLIAQMEKLSDQLFFDCSQEHNVARIVWNEISCDSTFIYKIQEVRHSMPWQVPLWSGNLNQVINVQDDPCRYVGVSVDGSQIYPDRHQGTGCFLINIGSVVLEYGVSSGVVYFDTKPCLFTGYEYEGEGGVTPDYVNCVRQEFELQSGLDLVARYGASISSHSTMFLFDGSLIFWHLASKQHDIKRLFLGKYINLLHQWRETGVLIAGYISLPKSKELVSLIRCALCNFDPLNSDAHKQVEHLVDTSIVRFFLKPGTRTIVFKSMSSICQEYPEYAHPYFFYMHVGMEIVRIEIPFWIAQSDDRVDVLCQLILDQCKKGFGYPVLIAEAHEQAVVKGPDRDFFYHLITKLGIKHNRQRVVSAKSVKKRGIGI